MSLTLQDPELERLLLELVTLTGEDPTVAVIKALNERLSTARRTAQSSAKQQARAEARLDEELWGY